MYNVHQNGRMYRNCTRINIFMQQTTDRFFSFVAELRKIFTNDKVPDYHILMNSIGMISIAVTTATFCGVWWEKFCHSHTEAQGLKVASVSKAVSRTKIFEEKRSLLIQKCMVLRVSELSGISTQNGFMLDLLSKPNGKICIGSGIQGIVPGMCSTKKL